MIHDCQIVIQTSERNKKAIIVNFKIKRMIVSIAKQGNVKRFKAWDRESPLDLDSRILLPSLLRLTPMVLVLSTVKLNWRTFLDSGLLKVILSSPFSWYGYDMEFWCLLKPNTYLVSSCKLKADGDEGGGAGRVMLRI